MLLDITINVLHLNFYSIKEQKEKLREAKLRALAGEEPDESGPPGNRENYDDDEDDDLSDVSS